MTDRDIPSVPVTTLAGLNSLSDLLSELPVSDSLNNVAQLNKSLLFHTLVANESANLLSVRDDNLVRQLVHAIEQTNSDNIELKPQFSIQQHGANISTYPELLQGIYNFRPTVFNTPQRIPNHQIQQHEANHNITIPSQQFPAGPLLTQQIPTFTDVPEQQHQAQAQQATMPQHIVATTEARRTRRHAVMENELEQQQQQQLLLQQQDEIVLQQNMVQPQDIYVQQNMNLQQAQSPQQHLQQQQQHHTPINNLHQSTIMQSQPQTPVKEAAQLNLQQQQQQCEQQEETLLHKNYETNTIQQQQTQLNTTYQMPIQQQQHEQLSQQQALINQQHDVQMQQQQQWFQQQQQPQQIYNNNNSAIKQQHIQINQYPQQNEHEQQQQIQIQAQIPTIQGNFQNVLNAQRQHLLEMQQKTILPQQQQQTTITIEQQQQQQQNIINQNSKAYEQMSTVSTADDTTTTTTRGGKLSENHAHAIGPNAKLRVCINRVKAKDALLLQKSIKKFVQKSPEMAMKMGLLSPPQQQPQQQSSDTFTMMKADEKRTMAIKRKNNMSIEDLPPEEIYTKPKVRRVERKSTTALPKCSKEEVMRSQTYQQFMRNMEQIIELLDDTETPNFDSDEVDENIECISSKMLNTMSNDVAKLKAKQVLDSIPKNKLTLLINYAMRNVYLSKNYAAGPDMEDEVVDDDAMEKILNAMEACLLVCNIYSTAKDLKFLQEDNISMIIKFIQFQLHETIFPSYDAVYTVKSMKKTDNRRKGKSANNHSRNLQLLYSKAVELMKVFVTLFDKCIFVDTIVLPLSTLAIEPFFVDNIETLQFVCLELVTTVSTEANEVQRAKRIKLAESARLY